MARFGLFRCHCVTLTAAAILALLETGCTPLHEGRPIRLIPGTVALSLETLRESVVLEEGEQAGEAIVAMLKHAKLSVISTTQDILARSRKGQDEVIVVLSGEGVSELDGVRDLVSQGHVIVIPRKTMFYFQPRGDEPVTLLSILIPPKVVEDLRSEAAD